MPDTIEQSSSPSPKSRDHSPLWADRALFLLAASLLLLLGWRWYRDHYTARPTEIITSPKHLIDLNLASASDLEQLPGFGPGLAARVVRYREANGSFQRIDDLKKVGGIGDRSIEKIKPWVTLSVVATAPEKLHSEPDRLVRQSPTVAASPSGRSSIKRTKTDQKLNLNEASSEELASLPGIGATLAKRIIDARELRPFKSIEDLRRVGGIGAKKLESIREHVTVGD